MGHQNIKVIALFVIGFCAFSASAKNPVDKQIHTSLLAEQAAFGNNCDEAAIFLADNVSWHVEGATKTKPELIKLCHLISQRKGMPPRKVINHKANALNAEAGYTVSTYSTGKQGERVQVVTKVWYKRENQWQIVHAQESTSLKDAN
ncbi:hypothetical protein [Alteromonas ponticola]|uniref:Nuclear transport factor 2 family protein n=1 Tax=Alteromonas ponticola TaxID=2720613 RepID=A0ABX1R0S9_9ALTE|nr:hypothetical protein [Alteromonas ponticola]NMH60065.1 hypothetical protein [Alteromonas ponticola]